MEAETIERVGALRSASRDEWAVQWESHWRGHGGLLDSTMRDALVGVATQWLDEHSHGTRWPDVWAPIIEHVMGDATRTDVKVLRRAGFRWLRANTGHARWGGVWQAMLRARDALGLGDDEVRALLSAGARWLADHELTIPWVRVWVRVVRQSQRRGLSELAARVVPLAWRWLRDGDGGRWAALWTSLCQECAPSLTVTEQRELAALGARWFLAHRDPRFDRATARVLRRLVDLEGVPREVLPEAWAWLDRNVGNPRWTRIARGLIALDPDSPRRDALECQMRAMTPANESLDDDDDDDAVTPSMVPEARGDTVWQHLTESMQHDRAVRGTITAVQPDGYLIDLGVPVFVPSGNPWMRVGDPIEANLCAVDSARRTVRLRKVRPAHESPAGRVEPGTVDEGRVEGVMEYGVFVWFRGCCGLLHRSTLREGDSTARFAVGMTLRVVVLDVVGERISLALAEAAERAA